jgi:hypothetical protein
MEINIVVSVGEDRSPRASVVSSNMTSRPPPPIRSTTTLEDVSYVDLHFHGRGKTAELSTDGFMSRPSSQKSGGFRNDKE